MILSALLLVVGPLVLGVATAWPLARIMPSRWLLSVTGGVTLLGLGLHLMAAVSEVTDHRAAPAMVAGHHYVLAVLITTLFCAAMRHRGHRPRSVPAATGAELERGERARLVSRLHDTVGQGLAVIVMQLRNVEREPDLRGGLGVIDSTAREAMGEVRKLIGDLRRPDGVVGEVAAGADVSAVLNRFRAAGLTVRFLIRGREADVPQELHAVVIRVLRETLTNAMKYAAEDPISVELTVAEKVVLRVRSGLGGNKNGVLAEDCWQGGEGMRGLAELIGRHGGMLRFGPDSEAFEVLAVVPLPDVDEAVVATTAPVGLELVG